MALILLPLELSVVKAGVQKFSPKSSNHLKILLARMVTRSIFHFDDPKILGVTEENIVGTET